MQWNELVHPLIYMTYIPVTTQTVTPTTGTTVSINMARKLSFFINPAGSLLALTVNMPSSPQDGDEVNISTSQVITGVTMANGSIINALTSLVLGGFATYVYSTTVGSWMRVG